MKYYIVIAALSLLAACEPPPPNACLQAPTTQAKFGTPDNKGPCWGRTLSVSGMGSISSYMFEMRLPYYAVGTATYDGDTLVQAGFSR